LNVGCSSPDVVSLVPCQPARIQSPKSLLRLG
jgi:hypothetical protein